MWIFWLNESPLYGNSIYLIFLCGTILSTLPIHGEADRWPLSCFQAWAKVPHLPRDADWFGHGPVTLVNQYKYPGFWHNFFFAWFANFMDYKLLVERACLGIKPSKKQREPRVEKKVICRWNPLSFLALANLMSNSSVHFSQ